MNGWQNILTINSLDKIIVSSSVSKTTLRNQSNSFMFLVGFIFLAFNIYLIFLSNVIIYYRQYCNIMSETKFVIKKKEYNASSDSGAGVLVFDKNTKTILLSGESFSSNVKSSSWNTSTKVLTLTMVDGTVYTINLVDDTSGNVPTSLLCGLRLI